MTAAKPILEKVRVEIENRARLDKVLPCLIRRSEDPKSFVRVLTLRRLLGLCGLRPRYAYLLELLTRDYETYVMQKCVKGKDRSRTYLAYPGVELIEGGVERARKKLAAEWNARMKAEGIVLEPPPPAHNMGPGAAMSRLKGGSVGGVEVQLPDDWSDQAVDPCGNERVPPNQNPSLSHRVLILNANRKAASIYHDRLSEWVWRNAPWSQFPESHKKVMVLHVTHGLSTKELSERLGYSKALVTMILQRHRNLAGLGVSPTY